jgi:Ca2+-binding EF-hand superfamily protein
MSDKARRAFDEFDEDKDGYVDKFELKKALEKAGQQPSLQVFQILLFSIFNLLFCRK